MISVDAPEYEPIGPWVQYTIATPDGTFVWPPEAYGWGSALVKVKSKAAKDDQKAAGRGKAKTKKSGPAPLEVTVEMQFVRAVWSDPRGPQAILNAIDPNNPNGNGGPFDFVAADFSRRGGKSIDVDEISEVVWRGHLGSCTFTAKEWVQEAPAEKKQGTTTPNKSTEHTPGDEEGIGAGTVTIPRGDNVAEGRVNNTEQSTRNEATGTVARAIASRGFDGPDLPKAVP